jgi:hypothetical protein
MVKIWQTPQTEPLAVIECVLRDGRKAGGDGVLDEKVIKDGGQHVLKWTEDCRGDRWHERRQACRCRGPTARPGATDGTYVRMSKHIRHAFAWSTRDGVADLCLSPVITSHVPQNQTANYKEYDYAQ